MIFQRSLVFKIFIVTAVCCISAFAVAQEKLQIDIDNPSFRPLNIAIPALEDNGGWGSSSKVEEFRKELVRLLKFSGLFKITDEKVYSHLDPKKLLSQSSKLNVPAWKNLGVEGVIIGSTYKENGALVFDLKVVDLPNQKVLLMKKNIHQSLTEKTLAKKFGDSLLVAYTGKPGIFTTKLVFVGRKFKGDNKQVYISDFDGQNVKQITKGKTLHLSPSWSPDGKSVVYTSYKSGDPDLYMHNLETGKVVRLSGYRGIDSGGQFDVDGNTVVFSGARNGDTDIYTVSKKGGKRNLLIKG